MSNVSNFDSLWALFFGIIAFLQLGVSALSDLFFFVSIYPVFVYCFLGKETGGRGYGYCVWECYLFRSPTVAGVLNGTGWGRDIKSLFNAKKFSINIDSSNGGISFVRAAVLNPTNESGRRRI